MARWSDLAQWRGPSVNTGDGDNIPDEPADRMYEYRGVVVHIAVGYYEGTIAWQRNASADVSSHFVIGRTTGELAQVVDTDIRAWTQSAGNGHWLSVENEGFLPGHRLHEPGWEQLTDWQIHANAQIFARAHREYGVPLQLAGSPTGRGLGYHSMGAENGYNWGHSACPGVAIKAQLPLILKRAIEIVEGDDMSSEEVNAKLHAIVALGGISMGPPVPDEYRVSPPKEQGGHGNAIMDYLNAILGHVSDLSTGGIDYDLLAEKLAPRLAALYPTPAAIATAVNDDDHRRSAE